MLYASRLGKIPTDENFWYQDWDEDYLPEVKAYLPATWRYNASVGYRINDRARVSLAVNNLTNEMPPRDFSNIDYPYYNFNWYDTIGRSYYLNFTWKFGGEKLKLRIWIWKALLDGRLFFDSSSRQGPKSVSETRLAPVSGGLGSHFPPART